jgi:hypothetical protein
MSFASLAQQQIAPVIERVARADDLTLLVGAGASMEAGLPGWPRLIEMLLENVASGLPRLDEEEREAWVAATMQRDDLLGAGAVVEVMAEGGLEELIPDRLYSGRGPEAFAPGPIAHQVAALQKIWGKRVEILTTNYDDLLEQALVDAGTPRSRIRSYIQNRDRDQRARGAVSITHLHGIAGRSEEPKALVLTEGQYHRMQRGTSWQEQLVVDRLENSTCVFVGMSLADPNLIRYLYGYKAQDPPRHVAIFVRQGEPAVAGSVRAELEEAAARRWGRCGVQAVFVDHFADAAQLLYEIGHRREVGAESYRPIGERAGEVIGCIERGLQVTDQASFARRQVTLSDGLRRLLKEIVPLTLSLAKLKQGNEVLGLALWIFGDDGSGLTGWAHSDRAHQDPSTVAPVPVVASSSWVSVRAVCQGTIAEFDRDNYVSRWRFVRGLPLVLEEPTRIPIGALTIASTVPAQKSVLTKMPEDIRASLHGALQSVALGLLEAVIEVGEG